MEIKFIKATVRFFCNNRTFQFPGVDVNSIGVPQLGPYRKGTGLEVMPDLEISIKPDASSQSVKVRGEVYVTISKMGEIMGVKFHQKTSELDELISKLGYERKDWKRNSPRIPSVVFHSVVPGFFAKIKLLYLDEPLKLEIANVSLGGVGLITSVKEKETFVVGEELTCYITGDTLENEITLKAHLRNMIIYANSGQKDNILHLGLQFSAFEKKSKDNFVKLVKDTIATLKKG